MRGVLLLATAIFLTGCATSAQNRDDFKKTLQGYPSLSVTGSHVSNRRFEDVVATLERKWKECYGFQRTTTRTQGGMTTMNYKDTYHPKSRKVSNSLVEMTLQVTTEGMIMLSKVPEGGDYVVALDIERLPGSKTKLSWYSASLGGWKAAWERNKQWSDGKDVACEA
jgi:hypothetical protein